MTHVTLETDGALAIVTLDNPPQNRIGDQMADELLSSAKIAGLSH